MKKFSKLILEKNRIRNTDKFKRSPLTNEVDWNDYISPFIEFIEDNAESTVYKPYTGTGVFSDKVISMLKNLVDVMQDDYENYWINEVDDGSKECFFGAFNIDIDDKDLMDCIQPLVDKGDIDEFTDHNKGYFKFEITGLRFNGLNELIEDISDVHGKLKMLNIAYTLEIGLTYKHIRIYGNMSDSEIESEIIYNWKDSWSKKSQDISLFSSTLEKRINIYIYNIDTVQEDDLKY